MTRTSLQGSNQGSEQECAKAPHWPSGVPSVKLVPQGNFRCRKEFAMDHSSEVQRHLAMQLQPALLPTALSACFVHAMSVPIRRQACEKLTFLVSTQLVKSPIPVIKVYNDFHTPCRVQAPYLIAKDIAC